MVIKVKVGEILMYKELYSDRQRKLEDMDIFKYDNPTSEFKFSIFYLIQNSLTIEKLVTIYRKILIQQGLRRTIDETYLGSPSTFKNNFISGFEELIESQNNITFYLDFIELFFIELNDNKSEIISSINRIFYKFGLGYQFIENEIIRIDSELIHIEAVKPALRLLNETNYKGAQEEFLSAYEHYRHGKNKEALNDCLKTFESTMKAIISKQGWEVQENANANKLIQVCFDNNLIPSFWQTQISSLKSMLESSVPTGRNKLSGHGQGVEVKKVPDHLVAYMLHMTASTLVFLTTAEKELDKNE